MANKAQGEEGTGAAERPGASSPLPCLFRNNRDEPESEEPKKTKLRGHHKKSAEALKVNTEQFCIRNGINNCAFFTLTFPTKVRDAKELSRRFANLRTGVLSKRYGEWLRVYEQHADGGWHAHLLIDMGVDVRTGFDWKSFLAACELNGEARFFRKVGEHAVAERKKKEAAELTKLYAKSATEDLRREWAFWRRTAKKYGFGRTELVPIRSTEEAIGKYLGKYIGKNLEVRNKGSKGVRLVAVSKNARRASCQWSWNTPGAFLWRAKLATWAGLMGIRDMSRIKDDFGSGWVWKWADAIMGIDLATRGGGFTYPNGRIAKADGRKVAESEMENPLHVERVVPVFDIREGEWKREQEIDLDQLWNPLETCLTPDEALVQCIEIPPNEAAKRMRKYAASLEPYQRDRTDFHRWLIEFEL